MLDIFEQHLTSLRTDAVNLRVLELSEAYHFQKKLSETISMKMHEKVIPKGATN